MIKFTIVIYFLFSIKLLNAQNKIEALQKEIYSKSDYMVITSYINYHKHSKKISEGKPDTNYMHFKHDTVIYYNNKDSNFCFSTNKYFYSIYDPDSLVMFRIIDSTYISGWNYSVIFDFIDKALNHVDYTADTMLFILNRNIEDVSKIKYYKDNLIHLDIFYETDYNSRTIFTALKPIESGLSKTIAERMKRIHFANDSLIFSNICKGYSIDCYNMKLLPTKHYFYKNK